MQGAEDFKVCVKSVQISEQATGRDAAFQAGPQASQAEVTLEPVLNLFFLCDRPGSAPKAGKANKQICDLDHLDQGRQALDKASSKHFHFVEKVFFVSVFTTL
jgi:hypothetical protein